MPKPGVGDDRCLSSTHDACGALARPLGGVSAADRRRPLLSGRRINDPVLAGRRRWLITPGVGDVLTGRGRRAQLVVRVAT